MQPKIANLLSRLRKQFPLRSRKPVAAGDDLSKIFSDPTGWTVFDDVALRLKSLSTEELDVSRGDPGAYPGAFKIRLAGSFGSTIRAQEAGSVAMPY